MQRVDGFQTTDSFRFDRNTSSSSSSNSLSSSSGYGSRSSLFSSSNRRNGLTKYFKERLLRHKSLASLLLSPKAVLNSEQSSEIYESVWDLDEQINKLREQVNQPTPLDSHSVVSMSVDAFEQSPIANDDDELLSAAAWYQEGLPRHICDEYLVDSHKPIGSFLIRHSYTYREHPFVLSLKTSQSSIEHFLVERTSNHDGYRLQGSLKTFHNLSTLVLHHTVMPDILPVTLILPLTHSSLTPLPDINQRRSSSNVIHSVRF